MRLLRFSWWCHFIAKGKKISNIFSFRGHRLKFILKILIFFHSKLNGRKLGFNTPLRVKLVYISCSKRSKAVSLFIAVRDRMFWKYKILILPNPFKFTQLYLILPNKTFAQQTLILPNATTSKTDFTSILPKSK